MSHSTDRGTVLSSARMASRRALREMNESGNCAGRGKRCARDSPSSQLTMVPPSVPSSPFALVSI
jgi:hypothetical protein